MNLRKANNMVKWIACLSGCFVYQMTIEASGSSWDCGKSISSADKEFANFKNQ